MLKYFREFAIGLAVALVFFLAVEGILYVAGVTPLHERTVAALANLPKDREKVLRWKQRSGPNWVLKKLLKRLGMKFNAHMGRHTFGDLFHEAGGSLRDLTEAGRWASPACAMRYTGKRVERVRKGIARL